MASKYDAYWESRATDLALLVEAAAAGDPTEVDVSDIRPLGDRVSWYGNVSVRGSHVLSVSMAHATSLGRTVARLGLCERHPGQVFLFTITPALTLKVIVRGRHETNGIPRARMAVVAARTPLPDLSESEGRVDPSEACRRIHTLLERLSLLSAVQEVQFADGLYFFYEEGEPSAHGAGGRVVRVGNHPKADHRLKGRLQDHYNHRGRPDAKNWSVFRRYLGGALLRRENPSSPCLAPAPGRGHWERQGQLSCSVCAAYEQRVTDLLRERFRFRCVRVDDREERNGLEARLIATIAACDKCGPSEGWLGGLCYSDIARQSGLWNRHYVGKAPMTQQDLERFRELVWTTPGVAEVEDLSTTLLLIPCSAGKRGASDPNLPITSVFDFLGPEARLLLEQGRREAFGRPVSTPPEY